jgi:hypothetical protein
MKPAPPVRRIRLPESILNSNTLPDPLAAERRTAFVAAILLGILALAMYRPWVPRPFDILDFSEFLPLLRDPADLLGRIGALFRYYGEEHGRLNLVSYVGLALKWTILGDAPVLWQWARFFEMVLLVGGTYAVLRRLALRPLGALAGASLFVVSRVAGEGWTRMTMGEPLGLLFVLGGLYIATDWRQAHRPVLAAAAAGTLLALGVLSKEMMAGLVPLAWLIGTGIDADGNLGRPRFDADGKRWLFWTAVLPLGAFFAALFVAVGGGSESFTALYGVGGGGVSGFLRLMARPWFVQGMRPGFEALIIPGNTLLVGVILAGLGPQLLRVDRRAELLWPAIAALGLTLAFAILYIPWPYVNLYYAIPFLLGVALIYGMSIDRLVQLGRGARIGALLAWLGMLASAAGATEHAAAQAIARQQVNGEVVQHLSRIPSATRIVVARRALPPVAWIGTGPTLRRYALATGTAEAFPPTNDLLCQDVAQVLRDGIGRTVIVNEPTQCGALPATSLRAERHFRYVWMTWLGAGIAQDSLVTELLFGREAMATPDSTRR